MNKVSEKIPEAPERRGQSPTVFSMATEKLTSQRVQEYNANINARRSGQRFNENFYL